MGEGNAGLHMLVSPPERHIVEGWANAHSPTGPSMHSENRAIIVLGIIPLDVRTQAYFFV